MAKMDVSERSRKAVAAQDNGRIQNIGRLTRKEKKELRKKYLTILHSRYNGKLGRHEVLFFRAMEEAPLTTLSGLVTEVPTGSELVELFDKKI